MNIIHRTTASSRRHSHLVAALLGTLAATTVAVGVVGGTASAMTNSQWRAMCLNSGGEWDAYRMNGVMQYDCIWVTDSGYSIDTYRGGRFVQTCGATRGFREVCDTI